MISSASAKYFQGLVFILVRRPYAIGDCIHVSNPNNDTSSTGSGFWVVEDITLFATIVVSFILSQAFKGCVRCLINFSYIRHQFGTQRFLFTNERASLSNGALADSRIINSSKSYNASVFHYLKFPIDVPYEKLRTFHEALEAFVRNRPREWIGLGAFRAANVNASEAYIEYIVSARHRESWASWGQIRSSQSDLMGFGVELAKKLDIVYRPPTLPIDLKLSTQQAQNISREFNPAYPQNPSGMVELDNQTHEGVGVPDSLLNPPEQIDESERASLLANDIQSLVAQFPPRAKK